MPKDKEAAKARVVAAEASVAEAKKKFEEKKEFTFRRDGFPQSTYIMLWFKKNECEILLS